MISTRPGARRVHGRPCSSLRRGAGFAITIRNVRCLAVGDWVLARCDDGSLEVEYALFDAADVLLSVAEPGTGIRERGYLTTAGIARERLLDAGVTPEIAHAAYEALGPLRRLALGPAVAEVAGRLEATEALQGGTYRAETRSYDGSWLDLDAVARACALPDAALAMQLLHLVLVMDEVAMDAPVRLLGAAPGAKPGERSWRRVATEAVAELPRALRATAPSVVARPAPSQDDLRESLVRDLRARAELSATYRPRLHALASAFARMPGAGTGLVADDVPYEPAPLVDDVRAHAAMLHGELHVREVAQFLTATASADNAACDLAILAGRAWLAAGETAYARYFARRVIEDASASPSARVGAGEILDSTVRTNESMRPPPVRLAEPEPGAPQQAPTAKAPPGASLPPTAPFDGATPVAPPRETRIEIVETMPAPAGDPVRLRMTELARGVARDYRLAYGVTLRTNVEAIDAMQRHLRRRFADANEGERAARKLEEELVRHGALLSEILARSLGAYWIETSGAELGRWAMVVPPRIRVWPIGRVHRFFQRGRLEDDLVAFYGDLERASRGG
jgi:hypothetical protein